MMTFIAPREGRELRKQEVTYQESGKKRTIFRHVALSQTLQIDNRGDTETRRRIR